MTYRTAAVSARALALAFALSLLAGCSGSSHSLAIANKQQPKSATSIVLVAAPAPQVEAPFPTPVIDLSGSGTDIGREHAEALGDGIRKLHGRYIAAYFKSATTKFIAMTAASLFEPKIAPEHMAEVKALASYSSIDPRQMLLAQCFLDLSPMTACSTVTLPASASPDGVARFGRNLDFPSFDVADKASVVLVYRPQHRYAFASVAWPGMVGVLSGMNEHGLTLANMEVKRGARVPSAMPYTLLYRSVLENCKTVDEAVAFLRNTPRQSANNLMLMDAAGERAVVELTPESVTVRRGSEGSALISTNHQRGQETEEPGLCRRYDSLNRNSKKDFGHIDVAGVESLLAGASQGKMTLQSMVFEPANRVIYLATGKNAATGEFHRLDLRKHFEVTSAPVTTASAR